MRAMVQPRLVAATVLLLAACTEVKGVEVDARHLIPAEANVVLGFDLAPVRGSALGSLAYTAALAEPDLRAALLSIPNCKVDLNDLHLLYAGVMDRDDRFMAVIESPGIGSEDVIRCLEAERAKLTGEKAPWMLMFSTRGDVRTIPQEGGGVLVILNKNAIVVTEAAWESQLFDAIEKPEARNTGSALAKAAQAVDPGTDLWFSYALSDADRGGMGDVKGVDGVQAVTITGDLTAGLKLDVTFDVADAAKAGEFKEGLDGVLAAIKEDPTPMPPELIGAIASTVHGTQVSAKIDVSAEAMPTFLTGLTAILTTPETPETPEE